jgi:C-terminal processing protease CtpA/Prc
MQEQNRAYIIGTQSCGCVLGVLNHKRLKGGADLAISEIGFVTSKGRTLEGSGVTPDKPVAVTLADLQNQRDVALKEAEEYFNKKEN